jgi:hypothetical protein
MAVASGERPVGLDLVEGTAREHGERGDAAGVIAERQRHAERLECGEALLARSGCRIGAVSLMSKASRSGGSPARSSVVAALLAKRASSTCSGGRFTSR